MKKLGFWRTYITFGLDWLSDKLSGNKYGKTQWFHRYLSLEKNLENCRKALDLKYPLQRDANYAKYVGELEGKIKVLKHTVTYLQEVAEYRNKQMKAVGYIVYCTGCWAGGPDNKEDIDEDFVKNVEAIALRLRIWHNNMESKRKRGDL